MPRVMSREDWMRAAAYNYPNPWASPLQRLFSRWKDPEDPIGSLLEVLKWARIAPSRGVPSSVFTAQVTLESNYGLKQDALLGIKATKKDYDAGTWKRLKTHEHLTTTQMETMRLGDRFIQDLGIIPGTVFHDVLCWQDFHFIPGLADDFDLYFKIYERNRPNRWKFLTDPEGFIKDACTGARSYATDVNYPALIMGVIDANDLTRLDGNATANA